ncbi:hypothetical protein AK965_19120 [Vibrio sp. PID17_43]|nr:hypothetical protein AK965_19120 [Vibrio sp. PID17_43]
MDSWVSFILGLIESKNIHQASFKANDKALKFVVKNNDCVNFQQMSSKERYLRFFFKFPIAT